MNRDDLEALKERIKELKDSRKKNPKALKTDAPFTIALELASGTFVGLFCGFYLDKLLGSMPIFLIICLFLGTGASLRSIIRKKR